MLLNVSIKRVVSKHIHTHTHTHTSYHLIIAAAGAIPVPYSAGTTLGARPITQSFVHGLCDPHRLVMVAVQTDLQQVLQVALQLPDPLLHVLIWHQCFGHAGKPATT